VTEVVSAPMFGSRPADAVGRDLLMASPATGARGTIILLPGINGQTPHILEVATRLAAHRFTAVVADWWCEASRRGEIRTPADVAPAVVALDDDAIADATAALADERSSRGPVGVLGYCVGGTLALLTAARSDAVSASVAYYGVLRYAGALAEKPGSPLEAAKAVRAPVLAHYGTTDGWCPTKDVDELESVLTGTGGAHQVYRYPGAGHAFEETGRPGFRPVAAADAARRTLVFLDHYVRP
jgi:carboxymethylenebutenolidase